MSEARQQHLPLRLLARVCRSLKAHAMLKPLFAKTLLAVLMAGLCSASAVAEIGKRFPSERKVVTDPVTGVQLVFLTSTPRGDSKIYPTHPDWTSDGQWLVFRTDRAGPDAMAVNEATGDMVQVTEGGFSGMLNVDQQAMRLVYLRELAGAPRTPAGNNEEPRAMQAVEVDLERLFADSKAGTLKGEAAYQRIIATIPGDWAAVGDTALDADGQWLYFRVGPKGAAKRVPAGLKIEANYGPRNMGAGPTGIARVHRKSGKIEHVVTVGFLIGHIQANWYLPGELVFSWETGGKSPQRTWTVRGDGSGLRPMYPEANYEWVTHEAYVSKDEVAFSLMGHRNIPGSSKTAPTGSYYEGAKNTTVAPGQEPEWGPAGMREKPTGLGIINLRTREMRIEGQTASGSGLWHVHASADGRWAVGDDFARNLYLIDRRDGRKRLLSSGHKETARDHPHPTFSADGKRIQIQSAMLSADGRAMNIAVIEIPQSW